MVAFRFQPKAIKLNDSVFLPPLETVFAQFNFIFATFLANPDNFEFNTTIVGLDDEFVM